MTKKKRRRTDPEIFPRFDPFDSMSDEEFCDMVDEQLARASTERPQTLPPPLPLRKPTGRRAERAAEVHRVLDEGQNRGCFTAVEQAIVFSWLHYDVREQMYTSLTMPWEGQD